MRILIVLSLTLGLGASMARAEVVPAQPGLRDQAKQTAMTAAQKASFETAVADCEGMWDRATHMTKREWSLACHRVQTRLQNLQVK